jgi:hypothetical protein
MAEENQVGQQPTETKETEVAEVNEPVISEKKFTEDEFNTSMQARLARQKASFFKQLGVDDIETAINAVNQVKQAEEQKQIQKGEFEELLKTKTQEWKKKEAELQSQLQDIKVNKALLSSASKNKAINPDQVVALLQSRIKLNESGNVEIFDEKGTTRYNSNGEPLTTDELVSSGSGTVSNVDRQELNKPFNLEDLDMNNPEDRKKYAEYRKKRNSEPTVINLNK